MGFQPVIPSGTRLRKGRWAQVAEGDQEDAAVEKRPGAISVPRSDASDGRLAPVHSALPERARLELTAPFELFRVVTFLNRALKRDGYVFGLTQAGDRASLVLYDTRKTTPGGGSEESRVPGIRGPS